MDLIDDEDTVFANLRRYSHLFVEQPDVIYRVIRCSIELMNAVRSPLSKRDARFTNPTCLHFVSWIETVDGLCKNSGTGSLPDTPWSTEKIGVSQLSANDRVLKSSSYIALSDNGFEAIRPVFSGRNNKSFHTRQKYKFLSNFAIT